VEQAHLLFDLKYKNYTLGTIIEKYAPWSENNTKAYKNAIESRSGMSSETRMRDMTPEQRIAVVEAMHTVEGNTTASVFDDSGEKAMDSGSS